VLMYGMSPGFALLLDRELPAIASGFYPVERSNKNLFVWTSRRAAVSLANLDRRSAWLCTVRFRGARPDPAIPQPDLLVALDGVTVAVRPATNDFQDVEVTAPARPLKPGLDFAITSSTTFVPGGSDLRELGVQVNRLACRPAGAWTVLPPRGALGSSAGAAAVFGVAFGLTGMTAGSAVGAAALIAAGQAFPLSTGAAPYGAGQSTMMWLAAWIAFLMLAGQKAAEAWTRQRFRNTARFVVAISAGVLYLKLLALFHPSKSLVDAVFHAHRLEWVLGGRFYFTQLSTSATPFPYAIGLYLIAAPWSVLTADHVALLRIVVCASEVITGALLYLMIVRSWGDRLTGAVAVALFNFVPLSYVVVGHANLTNAFGQSMALAAVAAVTLLDLRPGHPWRLIVVILLATLGFISHVSTFALLLATLLAVAFFFRWMGGAALRAPARLVLLAATISVVLSVVLYWGHFGAVYQTQFERLRDGTVAGATSGKTPGAAVNREAVARDNVEALGRSFIPLRGRVGAAFAQTAGNIGWPILLFALVGAWRLWAGGVRDRLVLVVVAWGVACLGFAMLSVLTPVEMRFQQDAWEFLGRVEHATYPAAVILAASGAVWAWRGGMALRLASGVLLLGAVITGVRAWTAWLH
ncbi:MAG: hypothetical protein IMZ55_05985, partial [Acidobacteria bacterium]|nr:hypothetical protein [Acidobacteriota bacterium]